MSKLIPCIVAKRERLAKGELLVRVRPVDPLVFAALGYISVPAKAAHAAGGKLEELQKGDAVEVEAIAFAFRVWKPRRLAADPQVDAATPDA
jgi:hypothetical protein